MSAAVTEVTGATLVRLGVGMRVPVTTISETSLAAAGAAAAAALAWVAERPATAAPHIIDVAKRRARIVVVLKIKPSTAARLSRALPIPKEKSAAVTAWLGRVTDLRQRGSIDPQASSDADQATRASR